MGTKVHSETLSPGYHHSMRDLNNDLNGCRLPLLNSDSNKTSANDQSSYKDVVRRTMLEHEAVFKAQVLELHRVYGIQKDMMDELKRKQFNKELFPLEASCSTPSFPLTDRPSMSVVEDNGHSPMKGGYSGQAPWQNGASSKHVETLEVRPTKIRRKMMIDLCIPADEYIDDSEDVIELKDHRVSQLPNGAEPRGDSLRIGCGSSSRSNGLADLNEPFKETNEVAYGSVREHVPVNSLQPDENGKPKAWWPQHQHLRTDPYTKSATPFLQPGRPLDSSARQRVSNTGPPPQSKADFWRGKTFIDLEADNTDTNTSHESSFASPQPRHLYPYNPPESAVSWNRLHSSSFGFPQRVRYPVLNLSDTNAQKLGCLGDNRLQFESNGRYNSGCGSATRSNHNNMLFSGSGYNYPNGGRSDYSQGNAVLDLNGSEVKTVRDLNLNVTFSNTSVVEVRKDDGRWNLNSNDAVPSSSLKPSDIKKEEGGNSVQNLMWLERLKSGSCSSKPETEMIKAGTAYRDEDKVHKVRIMLDINKPCEPLSDEEEQQMEKQTKFHIDLNMSVSEDEDENRFVPTGSRLNSKRPMIDLETVPESDVEEEEDEKPSEEAPTEEKTLEKPPEFEKTAAETIVAISSSACLDRELLEAVVTSSPETVILHWFAETVDTHRENLDQKLGSFSRNQARSIEEIDYFESMTLQLREITEEEYMPEPLVPEDLKLEETSAAMVTSHHQRPRRGNARKGKQRRDFQRDILPGLLSLSKHEVTEDIQMFDGFMRATGSSWTPTGLTRKKTGARGRPRRVITNPEPVVYYPAVQAPCPSVQQQHVSNNGEIEMGFEDGSFGGWGKMTRRPRRQRCPSSVTTCVPNVHQHTRMSRDGWE